ncbi:ABC-type transporter Mla subunit MlaD [Nonomuraea muscovyensis]|uniref:ABC-type transporter Mla subunit MlaD n=1 Tax=Nonomuraea muscovyensis TaxID=1124761 RepID=A0A7X0CAS6_9ACTN|nr:hypothetical protein [Nonomuraea muscovyensis]MBB6351248.1 ABC-type transporter Mla subunit MlaD [Nonomuraea muscovyensis]
MPNRHPYADPDLQEVNNRNRTARQLLTTFARSASALHDMWRHITAALDDGPALVNEITRLRAEIRRTRLSRANLLAAAHATLSAHRDGEPDPLYYLRDELTAQEQQPTHGHPVRGDGS